MAGLKERLGKLASPGTMLGMLALCVALSGTALAAATIGSSDVKNNSLRGIDVKNKSLTKRDFRGSVRGPRGLRGPTGPTGAAGSSVAYAHVTFNGVNPVLDADRSKNITAVTRTVSNDDGFVCVNTSVPIDVAVTSADNNGALESAIVAQPGYNPGTGSCADNSEVVIALKRVGVGLVNAPFSVTFD
jgi:hypothetical protein